jgi:curved DNA-binding protein CbpA
MPFKISREEAYETLEIAEGATEAEIRTSYKRLALKTHPDKNPHDINAKEKFLAVSDSYKRLTEDESDDDDDYDEDDDYEDAFDLFSFMFEQMYTGNGNGGGSGMPFGFSMGGGGGMCDCPGCRRRARGGGDYKYVPPTPTASNRYGQKSGPDPLASSEAQQKWLLKHGLHEEEKESNHNNHNKPKASSKTKSKRAQKRENAAKEQKDQLERQGGW